MKSHFTNILTQEWKAMAGRTLARHSKMRSSPHRRRADVTQSYYFASSIKVFTPLIFSFCMSFNVCLAFFREMAANA